MCCNANLVFWCCLEGGFPLKYQRLGGASSGAERSAGPESLSLQSHDRPFPDLPNSLNQRGRSQNCQPPSNSLNQRGRSTFPPHLLFHFRSKGAASRMPECPRLAKLLYPVRLESRHVFFLFPTVMTELGVSQCLKGLQSSGRLQNLLNRVARSATLGQPAGGAIYVG